MSRSWTDDSGWWEDWCSFRECKMHKDCLATLLQQFIKLLLNLTIYKCSSKCSTFLVASPCFYYYFIMLLLFYNKSRQNACSSTFLITAWTNLCVVHPFGFNWMWYNNNNNNEIWNRLITNRLWPMKYCWLKLGMKSVKKWFTWKHIFSIFYEPAADMT